MQTPTANERVFGPAEILRQRSRAALDAAQAWVESHDLPCRVSVRHVGDYEVRAVVHGDLRAADECADLLLLDDATAEIHMPRSGGSPQREIRVALTR